MRSITDLKKWQVEAFQLGRPAQHYLIQSPGGAGKSLVQVILAQADIEDTGNKQLILVPKSHIHHGFYDEDGIEVTLPGRTNASRWSVTSNFCASTKNDAKTKMLAEYLVADVHRLRKDNRLAAIATHKAMVEAWKLLSNAEKKLALRNISFRIDESHHLSNVIHESDLEVFNRKDRRAILDDATRLGQFINQVLTDGKESVKVHLATATFFRGDRRTILSEQFRKEFVKFYLPWDEHFESLGIEELTVDFANYSTDPLDSLLQMVRLEPNERHLIIIPAMSHRFRTQKTLSSLLDGLKEVAPSHQILDLVTPSTQEANKSLLHSHPEDYRVVVACRLFDEGTDWVPCSRLHNTDACEQSTTLAVQRIFRPLRRHPQKKVVRILNYLPDFSPDMGLEEKRQVLSNRLNAFLACIVTQGELMPTLVRAKGAKECRKTDRSLQEVYGKAYLDVMSALLQGYESVENKTHSHELEQLVKRVNDKFGVPEDVDSTALKEALLYQLVRIANSNGTTLDRNRMLPQGIDAEAIRQQGFDKVWEKMSPVPSVLVNGTDNLDGAAIRQLLSVVKTIPTLDEIHSGIRAFHHRTGKCPTFHQSEWLTDLGRSASAIDKILRRHFGTTLAKEVKVALGNSADDLLTRTHELIRHYWNRGIRIGNRFGSLPEIGMSSFALNGRLTSNYGTTLAKEVEKVLGSAVKPLTLPRVRQVVKEYRRKGIRLHCQSACKTSQ